MLFFVCLNCKIKQKRYESLLFDNELFKLFQFENESEVLKAYFCYLVYIFTSIIKEVEMNNKSIHDSINFKTEKYDLQLLFNHFENAITQSSDRGFFKIITANSKSNSSWALLAEYLFNKNA